MCNTYHFNTSKIFFPTIEVNGLTMVNYPFKAAYMLVWVKKMKCFKLFHGESFMAETDLQ